ncbi:solute carrier family 13 member 2 [Zootoca vivipara]|uniref:solute carrier family 13 member 2 n=1 Tax=Zootoca vivipara TaxID=8524 RepID=UPI00293BD1E2|nr:solute carrier family 13 member 2 [Zootoca vivipara]
MWREILAHRNYLIVLLTPFLFLPLPVLLPYKEAQCGYTIILMALFWCTEALPLAVTALLPVLLFPLMGIMDSTTVCMEYLKDTNMLFIGGLLVAIAVEHWDLHKRIALRVLLLIGVRPGLLLMGFMAVTAFLSMWISNTATTAMMVPIAQAVLEQLHRSEVERLQAKEAVAKKGTVNGGFELQETAHQQVNGHVVTVEKEKVSREQEQLEKKHLTFCKGMSLSVCYAASIGGIATLTGTTPNLVMKGQMDDLFPDNDNVVNFASWFSFAFPTMVLLLFLSWVWLLLMFLGVDFRKNFGCGTNDSEKAGSQMAYRIIKNQHQALGPMKFSEITVLVLFVILVLLWFTREPGFMPGWASAAFTKDGKSYVTDATVVIFISMLLFLIPSEVPRCGFRSSTPPGGQIRVTPPLLDWPTVNQKMPWNIVILLGGGFALAKGSEASGLSKWLGSKLTPLETIPHPAIAFVLCLLVAVFTECTSNVATTTLFLPILASMAQAICLNPLYVMLPCTLSASLAFMLPVATPPNAIVFSYGQLRVIDMVKAGCMLNLLGVLTITLAINTWGFPLFDLHNFPNWANGTAGQC